MRKTPKATMGGGAIAPKVAKQKTKATMGGGIIAPKVAKQAK
jgi:hypothetical protein